MNRKVWIGLVIAFLALALVLVLQMPYQDSTPTEAAAQPVEAPEIEDVSKLQEESSGQDPVDQPEVQLDDESGEDLTRPQEEPQQQVDQETAAETPAQVENPPTGEEAADKEDGSDAQEGMHVTLSVSVHTLLEKKEKMDLEKWELLPGDGWIFQPQQVEFHQGESVFNVLLREMKKNRIHMEFESTPMYDSSYIQGIGNIYEFDCGELSGWMYSVNDMAPSLGTSNFMLEDGEVVRLMYSCDLGRDLGFEFNE